jgi:hypothetical protein
LWAANSEPEARFLAQDENDWTTTLLCEERQKLGASSLSALQLLARGRVWHLAAIAFSFGVGPHPMSFFYAPGCENHFPAITPMWVHW